jgi:hypothetical protein
MYRLSQRTVVVIDVLLALWVLVWVWVGIETAQRVGSLRQLGDGVVSAGEAASDVADALGVLGNLPLVGSVIDTVVGAIAGVGDATAELGRSGQEAVDRAAAQMGWAIAVAPTFPFLVIWIAARIARERDRRSIRTALRGGDAAVLAYLAHVAVTHRPYRELLAVTSDPMGDLRRQHHRELARLQLDRLRLTPSPPVLPPAP